MDEYGDWVKIVLGKIKKMLFQGAFIPGEEVRYVFLEDTPVKDYDEDAVRNEDRALLYLISSGVVYGERSNNEFRRQQLQGYRDYGKEHSVWLKSWDEADEAYRRYHSMTWLYGVNVDRFERELTKFSLVDSGTKLTTPTKNTVPKTLTNRSYDSKNGILYLAGQSVQIVKQKNRLSSKQETLEGRAMRLLFNDVNSMKNGVPLRKIAGRTSVYANELSAYQQRSARNQIAEINKKVKEVTDGKNLIKIRKDVCYIDPLYL